MKKGDKVQVWNEKNHICLGWGTIIEIAASAKDPLSGQTPEGIPLIKLESGKAIWGDKCNYIEEKRAAEMGIRLFRAIMKEPGEDEV